MKARFAPVSSGASGLRYLQLRFDAPVPPDILEDLLQTAPAWERREYGLLLKNCPLSARDSIARHVHHFRRIRPFDASWSAAPLWIGFPQYLQAFWGSRGWAAFFRDVWPELKLRRNKLR